MIDLNSEVVQVKELEKKFGRFVAVDKVSFSVRKGEIFGFLGPNGAGKSTTIRMLCGIITPTSGFGSVAGYDIFAEAEDIKQTIGYMSQKFSLYEDLTVHENLEFYSGVYKLGKAHRRQRVSELINKMQLSNITESIVADLPAGWKQTNHK